MGECTTADWPIGETIVDPHSFTVPDAGSLRVQVGLYRLADNYRLRTSGGGDYADLSEIVWP